MKKRSHKSKELLRSSFFKLGYEFGKIIAPKNLEDVKEVMREGGLGMLMEENWNILKIENCAIGMSVKSNKPVCSYVEGLLSAFLECIYGKKFIVKEIKCMAQGYDACYFEIKDTGILSDADDYNSLST